MYKTISILLCLIAVFSVQIGAQAAVKTWNNASGGSWFSPGNWNPVGVPGAGDTANVSLDGTYAVTIDAQRVRIAQLVVGGNSGIQTLRVVPPADSLILEAGSTGTLGLINSAGRLSVGRAVLDVGAWCSLENGGAVTVDSLGRINLESGATLANDSGGTVTFSGRSGVYGGDPGNGIYVYLRNDGVITKSGNDTLTLLCQYSYSPLSTGSFTLQSGVMQIWSFMIHGLVTLASGTTTVMLGLEGAQLEIDGGIVDLQGTANIFGSGNITNRGLLKHTLVGTSTITCNHFGATGGYQKVQVVAGKLSLAGGSNMMTDSVEIGPAAELETRDTYFMGPVVSTVADSGRLNLTGVSSTAIFGAFTFSGDLIVNSFYVNFNPTTNPVSLHAFTIDSSATFMSSVTVNVDVLNMNGGSTNSDVTVGSQYNWTSGTFIGNTGTSVSIDPGISLNVSGPQPKQLDTRNLLISGSSNMSGSGQFAMSGGASITVNPSGSLSIGDSMAITGVGDSVINHGQMTFNCPLDTAMIAAFLYNTPTGRTPGTIDILSGPVQCADAGNDGTININNGGKLIITGSLSNNSAGQINLIGGAEMQGSGTITNAGHVDRSGSALLTTTNSLIGNPFCNVGASSSLEIAADTLTLQNGGSNEGDIYVHAGAVLRVQGTFVNAATGTIRGDGTLDVSNATFSNNGTISPGASPGTLRIAGAMNTLGTINIEAAGRVAGTQYDRLLVGGNAALGGTLHLSLLNGFVPTLTDTMRCITYGSRSGQFAAVTGISVGNGTYMEIAYHPTEIVQYVCNGISDIAATPVSLFDSARGGHRDTLAMHICNNGHCPLVWTATFVQTSPPSPPAPAWLTIVSGSNGLVTRAQCMMMQVAFDASGLAAGSYTGYISINSNDPDQSVTTIPVQFVVSNVVEFSIGSSNADFATFTAAVTYLTNTGVNGPTVFHVNPGTYEECVTVGSIPGASAINTITFRADDSTATRLIHCSPYASPAVWLNGADHVIFDRINITKAIAPTQGFAVRLTNDADSNTFRHLTITGAGLSTPSNTGITIFAGCDGNVVEYTSVLNSYNGVTLGNSSGSSGNNEVRFCTIPECVYGIQIYRQSGRTVHDCDIQPGYAALSSYGCRGVTIYSQTAGDTALVYNNRIHNFRTTYASGSSALGINAQFNAGLCRVYNNFIYDWHSACPAIGVATSYDAPLEFCANSVHINSVNVAAYAVYVDVGTGLSSLRNNILEVDGASSASYSIYNYGTLHNNCDYNCFYSTSANYRVGIYNGTTCTTLSQWQSVTGLDAHSLYNNPGFCSATDLHIERFAHSPVDSAGCTESCVTSDLDGEPRGTPPDIGADEFSFINGRVNNLVIRPDLAADNASLSWSPVTGARTYQIYCSDSTTYNINPSNLLAITSDTTYVHQGILGLAGPGHLFYHIVTSSALP